MALDHGDVRVGIHDLLVRLEQNRALGRLHHRDVIEAVATRDDAEVEALERFYCFPLLVFQPERVPSDSAVAVNLQGVAEDLCLS